MNVVANDVDVRVKVVNKFILIFATVYAYLIRNFAPNFLYTNTSTFASFVCIECGRVKHRSRSLFY